MKEAIVVTLAIGPLKTKYEQLFIPSIKAYAAKWNFDFLCIDSLLEPIQTTSKTDFGKLVCMQKLLLTKQSWASNYKYIIYLDSDILINYEQAPNILENIPEGKIAAVNEKNIWGNADNASAVMKKLAPHWASTAEEYYLHYNFPKTFSKQFNGGVLVFQPAFHKEFCQTVYDKYIEKIIDGVDIDGDQAPLNYEANSLDLVYYLDERFNRIWILTYVLFYSFLDENNHKPTLQHALKSVFDRSYFIHFAGKVGWSLLT
jgi:lipopolysaccharide biosynthesis glycosyltransferase